MAAFQMRGNEPPQDPRAPIPRPPRYPQPQQQPQQPQYQPQQQWRKPIARLDMKGRILDMQNGMALPPMENASSLHGGGGKNGVRSVIRVSICDYTKGTGEHSVTTSFNLVPTECFLLREAALERVLHPQQMMAPVERAQLLAVLAPVQTSMRASLNSGLTGSDLVSAGKAVSSAINLLLRGMNPEEADFELGNQILNIHAPKGNDTFEATKFRIWHSPYKKGRNGDVEIDRAPWKVTISNGVARNGMVDGKVAIAKGSFQQNSSGFFAASDRDFYSLLRKVCATIEVWEQNVAAPQFVKDERSRQQWVLEKNKARRK